MNILVDALPQSVTITNTEYLVDSDFRTCLKIILAFEDSELTPQEKQVILLSMLFVKMPPLTQETFDKAIWFLNGGRASDDDEETPMRLYSFNKDANFVFAAFRQTHGIDLQKASLHWWEFLALFMDLGSETTFCQLTALRKRLKTGKATKEERAAAREAQGIIDIGELDDRTLEEKELEAEFIRRVEEARARNGG